MPKPKRLLRDKPPKKRSKQPQAPESADEFLAAGVDFEEAGEKWRGGDAAKSTRFFLRAIECYEEALKKFPGSFDLAYNKARVQYELTQYPKLLDQLPGDLADLLATALESSRYALGLKQDNADVLFNTAQILTSLVEATTDSRGNPGLDTLSLLEEALGLFQRCLALQEYQHTESQAQAAAAPDDASMDDADIPDMEDGGASLASDEPQDDRWATIVEPITNDTLLDTLLAQVETLTLLCNLTPVSSEPTLLTFITEYSTNLLNTKLPFYLKDTGREPEAHLITANFTATQADLSFRFQKLNLSSYIVALADAFSSLDLADHPEGLVNKAEALISFNASVRTNPPSSTHELNEALAARWKALTTALDCLTAASKLSAASNLAKIHILRGDGELLRYQLGQEQPPYDIAAKNGQVLCRNAEKFYRGAAALCEDKEEKIEANVKEALAKAFGGDVGKIAEFAQQQAMRGTLEEAIDESLVRVEQFASMGIQ